MHDPHASWPPPAQVESLQRKFASIHSALAQRTEPGGKPGESAPKAAGPPPEPLRMSSTLHGTRASPSELLTTPPKVGVEQKFQTGS